MNDKTPLKIKQYHRQTMYRIDPTSSSIYPWSIQPDYRIDETEEKAIALLRQKYAEAKQCEMGQGTPHNLAKAFAFYEELARAGYTPALVDVAHCLCNGLGTKRELSRAAAVALEALSQDLSYTQRGTLFCVLGLSYEKGHFQNSNWIRDIEQAEKYYQEACRLGNIYGFMFFLKASLIRKGSRREFFASVQDVIVQLTEQAKQGDLLAHTTLGFCYLVGLGVEQDNSRAIHWFQQAAAAGYASAQYHLGNCYVEGYGLGIDLALAAYHYRQAAAQGHVGALNKLSETGL